MGNNDDQANRSAGVSITAGGDVYIGGDVVGRDKITVFDAAVINWLALGTNKLLAWLRLLGAAGLMGLFVAMLGRQVFGIESATDSAAVSIWHAALGAIIGGLAAWYSPSLPAALLRVGWVEGGLVAAEWLVARVLPISERSVPVWFGLPILHASLLVSLIGGPWLALTTFALVRLAGPRRNEQINRRWGAEVAAILTGCLASGLLVVAIFGSYLDGARPPIDPSQPTQIVPAPANQVWLSGPIPIQPGCDATGCPEYARFDTHRDGFIVLPGWLSLTQAVAILIFLAMIIPASAALLVQTQGSSARVRRPAFAILIGFVVSAAIGVALDAAATRHDQGSVTPGLYEQFLSGPLAIAVLWGAFGLVSGFFASALYSLVTRPSRKPLA